MARKSYPNDVVARILCVHTVASLLALMTMAIIVVAGASKTSDALNSSSIARLDTRNIASLYKERVWWCWVAIFFFLTNNIHIRPFLAFPLQPRGLLAVPQ